VLGCEQRNFSPSEVRSQGFLHRKRVHEGAGIGPRRRRRSVNASVSGGFGLVKGQGYVQDVVDVWFNASVPGEMIRMLQRQGGSERQGWYGQAW